MTRSVVPQLLQKLEPYLEERAAVWEEGGRFSPSLPATSEGKVNVRGIVKDLAIPVYQEQHFFRHAELRAVVNAVAEAQGLKPIGYRNEQDDADVAVGARIKQDAKRASDLGKLVAEQAATIEWQRREIVSLREQLRIVEETGQIVRFNTP